MVEIGGDGTEAAGGGEAGKERCGVGELLLVEEEIGNWTCHGTTGCVVGMINLVLVRAGNLVWACNVDNGAGILRWYLHGFLLTNPTRRILRNPST